MSVVFFFFSSRRRHTRFDCDWSSDVCSSDLDGEIAFQPLARIDREGYRTWAAEWIEGRLRHEGVAVGPDEKAAIWSALGSLAGAPVEQRTMTGLSVLLQSRSEERRVGKECRS